MQHTMSCTLWLWLCIRSLLLTSMSSGFYARQAHAQHNSLVCHTRHSATSHSFKHKLCMNECALVDNTSHMDQTQLQYLTETSQLKLQRTLLNAWQMTTMMKYCGGICRFIDFCKI